MRKLDEIEHDLLAKYAEWEEQLTARRTKLRFDREDFERQKMVLFQAYPLLQNRLTQELLRAGGCTTQI